MATQNSQLARTAALAIGKKPYCNGTRKLEAALEKTVSKPHKGPLHFGPVTPGKPGSQRREHTPGPWTKGEFGDIIVPGGEKLLIVGVALPCGHHPDKDQAEANRDLLWAAPDLLAACKALEVLVREYRSDVQNHILADDSDRFSGKLRRGLEDQAAHASAACTKARAAILKATGGAQ